MMSLALTSDRLLPESAWIYEHQPLSSAFRHSSSWLLFRPTAPPATLNFVSALVVPMPTLPAEVILIASAAPGKNLNAVQPPAPSPYETLLSELALKMFR